MIGKSIRVRIQIWHTALLTCLTTGLLVAFYFHEKEIMEREFDNSLMAPITAMIPHFVPPWSQQESRPNHIGPNGNSPEQRMRGQPPERKGAPRGNRAGNPDETEEERIERQDQTAKRVTEKGFYIVSMKGNGEVYYASHNAPEAIPAPAPDPNRAKQEVYARTNGDYRECIHSAPGRSSIIIGASTSILIDQLVGLRWTLILIGGTAIFAGFVVGWLLVGRSLSPIQSISKTAAEIAAGDLTKRIDLSETDSELGQMGEVLNETFSKLENTFDQQVRFTSDASHELRTPIAVILAKCQFALRKDRASEKYKDALKTCETSAQHIRNLVESLLELAKVDSGEFQVLKQDGDLKDIAENCVDLLSTLAEQKEIAIESELEQTPCWIDTDRVQQVAINLLSNAIKYTPEGGTIKVTAKFTGSACELTIKDTGLGIHPDDLPHLFDRFYRVNSDRSQDQRSTGLGLAITKAIVVAHGGDIQVSSKLGHGSSFKVTLPANQDSFRLNKSSLEDESIRKSA
ncbi:MAG: sensor histidine kinase [Opitutaceae bacterium]